MPIEVQFLSRIKKRKKYISERVNLIYSIWTKLYINDHMYTYIYKIFLYEQIIYVYTKYTRIYKYLYTPRGRRYNNTRTHARIIHLLRSHLSREKNPMKSFVKIHSLHPLRMHYIIYPQSLYIYIYYIYIRVSYATTYPIIPTSVFTRLRWCTAVATCTMLHVTSLRLISSVVLQEINTCDLIFLLCALIPLILLYLVIGFEWILVDWISITT